MNTSLNQTKPDHAGANSDRFARLAFYVAAAVTGATLVYYAGYRAGGNPSSGARRLSKTLHAAFSDVAETSVLVPEHLLQPARYQGSGVTLNEGPDNGDFILISGFFGDHHELRLMRRDGTLVNQWPVSFSKAFPNPTHLTHPPATDWNTDTHGVVALPDGSVVLNFDYLGLFKLDRCRNLMWTLPTQSHHSVERAAGGGFWVPGQVTVKDPKEVEAFPPFRAPIVDSTVMHVSEDGKILKEISIPRLFYSNDLTAVLTSAADIYTELPSDSWNREIVHLNKVVELKDDIAADFPMFSAGDLMISIRKMNLLLVFDPSTLQVKWWHVGPWMRQHDPEFVAGGKIVVFNNNTFISKVFGGDLRNIKRTPLTAERVSNVLEFDPATNKARVIYGNQPGNEMLSVTRGKVDPIPGGGVLVTEHDGGRAFEVDAHGHVIWQLINRYDEDEVAEITEARRYPKDYFTVTDWSCPNE